MDIVPVDPRDVSWEQDDPEFRVIFFEDPSHGRVAKQMRTTYEYAVSNCDIDEVLAWVKAERGDRDFIVYVIVREGSSVGAIRIAGTDPLAAW